MLLKSQKLGLLVLRYAEVRGEPDGRATNLPELRSAVSQVVDCDSPELVDALKWLHAEGVLRLRKWDDERRAFVEYGGGASDEAFFYRGGFMLLIAPKGRVYYEKLAAAAEADQPKPSRPIGFST